MRGRWSALSSVTRCIMLSLRVRLVLRRGGLCSCNKAGLMTRVPGSPEAARPSSPLEPIAERVRERLAVAGLAFDRRHGASRPRPRRRKDPAALPFGAGRDGDAAHNRERACLRSVFRDLGDAHRRYRARTGHAGTPALRAAAHAFKREPSILSLIPVAAFLDELGILAW